MDAIFRNPLFIDIETVSCVDTYAALSEKMKDFWQKKARYLGATSAEDAAALFFEKAAIFAEFGKVVVISVGYCTQRSRQPVQLYIRTFSNEDEKALLKSFTTYIEGLPTKNVQFVGHNIKEFDLPYLARRMTINAIPLPISLDTAGKKPWEVPHVDTMELWKFGDRKNYTSLDLLATLLSIPSSKEDMDGSEVNTYYYHKRDLESIAKYCTKDVITTVQVYRKLRRLPLIASNHVQKIDGTRPQAIQHDLPLWRT